MNPALKEQVTDTTPESGESQTYADRNATDIADARETSLVVWGLVAGIILVGLLFRAQLLDAFYLDFDESMHFQAAREATLQDTWIASRIHTHPPLVFLFYHLWLNFGDSEIMLRLPALIFSISALVFAFLWLREVTGVRPAVVGLVFLTFSMPMVHLGAQMRGYTLLLTFMFAALFFHERFLQRHSLAALITSAVCLGLAMLTHYTTAWLMLALGVLTLLRVISGTLPRKLVIAWAMVQVVLLGECAALYFGHVRAFVNSDTQDAMWAFWLRDSQYTLQNTNPLMIPLLRLLEFIKFTSGAFGLLIAILIVPGVIRLGKVAYQRTGSSWISVERALLIVLPMIVAMLLFQFRIYPLGHTRHSMWLIPFVALGISAASLFLFTRRSLWRNSVLAGVMLLWVMSYAAPMVWKYETTQTPEMMERFVSLIKQTVPEGEVILTDDSTRNVLEYYLVGREVIHGKPLGGGYIEYKMGNYRVVTIPRFHFFMYQFRKDWKNYLAALEESAREPLWVVYLGYERTEAKPEHLFPLFPAGQLTKQAHYLDNQIMRIQFLSPEIKAAKAAGPKQNTN